MAKSLSILFFFFFFFLLFHFTTMATALNEEALALLSFKQSIENQTQSFFLSSWNSSDSNPCYWPGVTCNNDLRVVSISLPNMEFKGLLHPSIANLSTLRHINLKNNRFYGNLPFELILKAKGLQSLVLSGKLFSGSIPKEIGRLKNLQSLDLSENFFSGSIPLSLMQCKKLKNLNLSFNGFTDLIPKEIGNLKNLKGILGLSHNFLSGKIPANVGNLPVTVYVDVSYNNLSGPIPQSTVLINSGPTAFQGNPFLCGLPLNVSCAARNITAIDSQSMIDQSHDHSRKRKHSIFFIIIIIIASVACTAFVSLLFGYYSQTSATDCNREQNSQICRLEEKLKIKKEWLCFKPKDHEPEMLPDDINQQSFMALDSGIDFDLEKLLKASAFLVGKSGIGIVYKVVLENGLVLAVRRLEDNQGLQSLKEFMGEVEAIGKIKHPNIVNLRACCWSPEEKLLIYDYITNGDLASAIHGRTGNLSSKQLSWPVRLRIMKGIAKGLGYIHELSPRRFIHGDINPSNILLGDNLEPKISGFGLSRLTNTYQAIHSARVSPYDSNSPIISGKSHYQAPEASRIAKPSQKWDVYSFGLTVLEMVTGKSPVLQTNESETDLIMGIRSVMEENKPIWYVVQPGLIRDKEMDDCIVEVNQDWYGLCVQEPREKA